MPKFHAPVTLAGTPDYITLVNQVLTRNAVDLTADVTGTLPVGNGGSGATTLTGILKGNGASAFSAVTAPSGTIVGDTDTQTLTNKKLTSPVIQGTWNGWILSNETWTYASSQTVTISGDVTSKYQKGDKVSWTQDSTNKYGHILSVTYADPNTTLTIVTNNDYTFANSTITNNSYSRLDLPYGFPNSFSYTPTQVGFSADQALTAYYAINGRVVHVNFRRSDSNGISDATTLTFTLPIAAENKSYLHAYGYCAAVDNTTTLTTPASWHIPANSSTVNFYKGPFQTAWTDTGQKCIIVASVTYFI